MQSDFGEYKMEIIGLMQSLDHQLERCERDLDLSFSDLRNKLVRAMEAVTAERFSMAVFGAFSDGKSTILSAATGRADIAIAPTPTTDVISVYEDCPDYCIVDTPGLFSGMQTHDETSRKYISEAHVILYITDATNPLKESHSQILGWLFGELQKLDVTLFAINKMDDVADLEDEEDFQRNAAIKKQALLNTLSRFVQFRTAPPVVCVAADPYQQGLAYWRNHINEYRQLSRMELLQEAMGVFVAKARDDLNQKLGLSVINEAVAQSVLELKLADKHIVNQCEALEDHIKENAHELDQLHRDVTAKYFTIQEQMIAYRDNLLTALYGASDAHKLREVILKEIGDEGYILNRKINMIVSKESGLLAETQQKALENLEQSSMFYGEVTQKIQQALGDGASEIGSKILGISDSALKNVVFKIRDILAKTTGKVYKFKPWEATKWASRLKIFGKFLKTLPLITEVFESALNEYNLWKFNKTLEDTVQQVEDVFQAFDKDFTKDAFISNAAPLLPILEETYQAEQEALDKLRDLQNKINCATLELQNYSV